MEQLKECLELYPGGVLIVRKDSVLHCNRRFSTMVGKPEYAIAGSKLSALLMSDTPGLLMEILSDCGSAGKRNIPLWLSSSGGESNRVICTVENIGGAGELHLFFFHDSEIAGSMGERLDRTEKQYFDLLESIGEGYYEVDRRGNFLFFNDSLCRILDLAKDDLLGRNYSEICWPGESERIFGIFNSVYLTEKPSRYYDLKLRSGRGEELFVEISIALINGDDGAKRGFRGFVRDVTRRIRDEEALRKSGEEYRHLVMNAGDIIYRNDRKGNFLFVNPVAVEKTGYSREELLGMNYMDIIIPDQREETGAFYSGLLKGKPGDVSYHELKIVCADGSGIWIGQNVKIVKDAGGRIEFHAVARDITQLKEMQQALRESEEKYRALVEEKTRDIIFSTDREARFLTVNRNIHGKLGYSEEDLRGKCLEDILFDDPKDVDGINRAMFREHLEKVLVNGEGDVRFRAVCAHRFLGEPVTLQFKLDPVMTGTGPAGIMGFATAPSGDPLKAFLVGEEVCYSIDNNLATAEEMSHRLTRDLMKYLPTEEVNHVRIGLREIIVNAIEHGNLGITYEEKTDAQLNGTYQKLLKERKKGREGLERKVHIHCSINANRVEYTIRDEGEGFDYRSLFRQDPDDLNLQLLQHGRGILIARGIFDLLEFRGKGDEIILVKNFPPVED